MDQQVFFHLLADSFSQDQFANARGAQRQHGPVKPPPRDETASEYIRVQQETGATASAQRFFAPRLGCFL